MADSIVREKYKNSNTKWIGGVILFSILFFGILSSASASQNINDRFDSVLTLDQIDQLLNSYFSNLNVTEIYNFYNITNNAYYYNQTFLNQTFNEYITNEYYEDNYYNTYNTYNQTFLNQTFIDNNYYTTINNNINNTLLEEMMTSINNIWSSISTIQNERIDLTGQTIIDLSGANCSQIEFMFKDSDILSIYDTLGLGIATQLKQINNVDFTSSFFFDNNNYLITNNLLVNFDEYKSSKKAIKTDDDEEMTITTINNTNIINNEIILNMAFQNIFPNDYRFLDIYQDNVKVLELRLDNNKFYIKDVINNQESSISMSLTGFNNNKVFKEIKLVINPYSIDLTDINSNIIMTLNSNPFTNTDSSFKFYSKPNNNKDTYFRSIFINTKRLEIIPAKFVMDSQEIEFERENWNFAQIYIMDDSVLYNINNNIQTKNYNIGQTNNDYNLVINLDKTSLSNLYCR